MTIQSYADFLNSKRVADVASGLISLPDLPDYLFPHQRDIVRWSLKRGRAAIFAGTGLGKTLMELTWCRVVAQHTGKPSLLFAPLAVGHQHEREAGEFGITARVVQPDGVADEIAISNYHRLERFDLSQFGALALDESSILKSFAGHYRTMLIEAAKPLGFRLAATATPAPNDFMELGNHAEFLGVMNQSSMLATFFTHDGSETQKWRLKGHAEDAFWRWMASWSVMLRKPSDLGYADDGYDLPPLTKRLHIVETGDVWQDGGQFSLLPMEAKTLGERGAARRDSQDERVRLAVQLVLSGLNVKVDPWSGNPNTTNEGEGAPQTIPSIAPNVISNPQAAPNTCANTTPKTPRRASEHRNSKSASTSAVGSDMPKMQTIGSEPKRQLASETSQAGAKRASKSNTGSAKPNSPNSLPDNQAFAPFADGQRRTPEPASSMLTTVTKPDVSGGFFAAPATPALDNFRTTQTGLSAPQNISAKPEPWVLWCHLNSEQEALKKALGPLAISIHGGMDDAERLALHDAWLRGDAPILIVKPSMFGHGLNWQHCCNTIFVGLNDSFEQVFQAIRRFWRFGQKRPVTAHFIAADTEGGVLKNLERKERDADRMADAMVRHMADLSSRAVRGAAMERHDYQPEWKMHLPAWKEFV